MSWEQTIVDSLKKADISLISYVPDHSIGKVASIIEKDDIFQLIPATREEEAIGIAVGGYAVGKKAAVFMQTSGFGNSVNAIATLCVPARAPIPMFINMRGGPGEFNISQVAMGKITNPIMDMLGIVNYTINDEFKMDQLIDGALKLCFANRQPVGICLTSLLHGGKSV